MRRLFDIDKNDYNANGTAFYRPSVRAVIIKDGRAAMVYSRTYGYYNFPGGGIEEGESHEETLIREVKEETGLTVIPHSIREYGCVHRVQKGMYEDMFVQDNYYYFADVLPGAQTPHLIGYEQEDDLICVYADFATVSKAAEKFPETEVYAKRDAQVMRMLFEEGYLEK